MFKVIRFTVKVSLAGGAVYYLAEQGVWKESTETTKLFNRISNAIDPYVQQTKAQLPIEIPELPSSNRISYATKQYWNQGVTGAFRYVGDLPSHASGWAKKGVEMAKSNPEIKKLFESYSSSAPAPINEK